MPDYEKSWGAQQPAAATRYAKSWGEDEPDQPVAGVRAAIFGETPKADFADTGLSEDEKSAYMRRLYPGEDVDPGSEVLDAEEQRRIFEETKAENPGVMGFPRRDWTPGVEDILRKRTAAAAFDKRFGVRRRADIPEIETIVAKHEPPPVTAGERAAYTAERFPSAMMGPAAGLARALNEKLAPAAEYPDLHRRMSEASEAAADPTVARLGAQRAAEIRADVESRPGWAFAAHATELAGAVPTFVGGGKALANPLAGFGKVVGPKAIAPTLMGLHGLESSGGDLAAAGHGVAFGGVAGAISGRLGAWLDRLPALSGRLGAWLDRLPALKRSEALQRLAAGFGKEGPAFAAADAILGGVDGSRLLEQYVFGTAFGLAGGHGDPKRRAIEAGIIERASAEMAAVVEKATPGATPEARAAYLEGDPSRLTPEQAAAANVATAPILKGFTETMAEAAKAAEGAAPRGPQETLEATLAGPEALAKAKEKTYDATKVSPETVAAAEKAPEAAPVEAPARPAEPAAVEAATTPTPEAPRAKAPAVESGRLVERVPVENLDIDPKTFQIKGGTDSLTGVTKKLEGTEAWDPVAGGVLMVWERADGRRFVVDGHHRFQLAKAKGVKDIPAVVLRESEGVSPGEARVEGAMANIRSGTIDPLDAAVVIREGGYSAEDLVKAGVPPRSAAMRDATGLAGLSDDLLSQVRNGELSREAGAEIGRQLPGESNVFKQRQAAREIRGMDRPTADEVSSLVRQVRVAADVEVRQESLFGAEVGSESLRPQIAKVEAALMARLRKEKSLHTTLAGNATRAEKVEGTKINVEGSKSEATKAAEALDLIQRSMDKGGAVAQIATDAARRLKDGASLQDVVAEAADRIRGVDFYRDEFVTGAQAPGAEPAGARADDAGLFGDRPGVPRSRTIEESRTGQSIEIAGFRGEGGTLEDVYGAENVRAGRATPILGPGTYVAETRNQASVYAGKAGKVSDVAVRLENPLVIDSSKQWQGLLAEADANALASVDRFGANDVKQAATRLQDFLRRQGHDGVVVKIPADADVNARGESIKRLRESFGHSQAVKFASASVAEPTPGDTVTGRTREGLTVSGTFERATDKSLVVTTPEGKTARIEKGAVESVERGAGEAPDVMGRPLERDASRTDEGAKTGPPALADIPQERSNRSAQDFPVARDPAIDPGRPVGVHEVVAALEKFAGKKLYIGRLRGRKSAGEYYPIPDYARIRDSNDPMSGAHELFHSIDKHVLPWAISAPAWKTMKAELLAVGHRLYPGRRPAGGWLKEGFAEYGADWMHNEAAARKEAPEFTRWWESEFLAQNPEFRRNAQAASLVARRYAGQGGVTRVMADTRRGKIETEWWDANEARRRWIDANDPINRATATAEAAEGPLPVSKSPAKLAELRHGRAAAIADRWIESGQTNIYGDRIGDSLRQIFSREGILGRSDEFVAYAMARQGLIDAARGLKTTNNPKDYQAVVDEFRSPEFDRGVSELIRFHKNLMDYLEASGAIDVETRDRMDKYTYIAPSERIIDPSTRRVAGTDAKGAGLARKHGATLQTRDIRESIITRMQGMIDLAHKASVENAMAGLARIEGMGEHIRKVPKERQKIEMSVEMAKASLEKLGIDVERLGLSDEMIQAWGVKSQPDAKDLIFKGKDGTWYEVNKDLYEAINGVPTASLNNPLVKWLWVVPGTIGRISNTSARAGFAMFNSARDAVMAYINGSVHNPAAFARNYLRELYGEVSDKFKAVTGRGTESPTGAMVRNLGIEHSTRFFQEAPSTIRKAQTLGTTAMGRLRARPFHTLARWPRNAFEWYRAVINATEIVPRRAEARATLERSGWKPGDPLTMDLLQGVLEGFNVTANFPKMGSAVRAYNVGVPFFGAAFTGPGATVRALKMRPVATTLKALGTLTATALGTWLQFKDDDWWKRLPHEQKWSYLHIPAGDQILRVPLQGDMQLFSIPVAALDAWYQKDPEGALSVALGMAKGMAPGVLPPLASETLSQVGNKDIHFGTPIETGAVAGLPAQERVNRRTTGFARVASDILGKFGIDFSPLRVDHAVRGVFGGAASDFTGLVTGHEKEPRLSFDSDEPWNLPVAGRLFQMGGKAGSANRHVESVFKKAKDASERGRSTENPESPREEHDRRRLSNAATVLSMLSRARIAAKSVEMQRKLSDYLNKIADKVDAGGDAPPDSDVRELVEGLGLVRPRKR